MFEKIAPIPLSSFDWKLDILRPFRLLSNPLSYRKENWMPNFDHSLRLESSIITWLDRNSVFPAPLLLLILFLFNTIITVSFVSIPPAPPFPWVSMKKTLHHTHSCPGITPSAFLGPINGKNILNWIFKILNSIFKIVSLCWQINPDLKF